MGRVLRRTSTKHRLMLVVRSLRPTMPCGQLERDLRFSQTPGVMLAASGGRRPAPQPEGQDFRQVSRSLGKGWRRAEADGLQGDKTNKKDEKSAGNGAQIEGQASPKEFYRGFDHDSSFLGSALCPCLDRRRLNWRRRLKGQLAYFPEPLQPSGLLVVQSG